MKFLRLVIRNILRAPLRTLLTMLGVAASIFIFTALLSLDAGTDAMVEQSGGDSVITVFEKYKACPPYSRLPVSYADKIAGLEHVVDVMPVRFLLSNCKATTSLIALHGVDPEKLRRFRKIEIPDGQYAAFEAERGAAIIGRKVQQKFGWQVGNQVTLSQLAGVSFAVRGVFDAPGDSLENVVLLDRTYLETATGQTGWATLFSVLVDSEAQVTPVSNRIDALFANYQAQTKSGPEKSFIASQITDFRDMVKFVQLVGYTALALLLAAVMNSVSMSVRERLREMAILKLMGFRSEGVAQLVLMEAVIVAFLGAGIGLGLAALALSGGRFSIAIEGFSIIPVLDQNIALEALGAGALLGLLGAYWPSLRGARLPIVLAMREVD